MALIDELEKDDGTFILFVDDLDLLVRLGGIVHQVNVKKNVFFPHYD